MYIGGGNSSGAAMALVSLLLSNLSSSLTYMNGGSASTVNYLKIDGGNSAATYTEEQIMNGGAST